MPFLVPLSVESSRQEYWSSFPFPTPGDLPDRGIEHVPPECSALAGGFFTTEPPFPPKILPSYHSFAHFGQDLTLQHDTFFFFSTGRNFRVE